MNGSTSHSRISLGWKIPAIVLCYFAGIAISGGVITALGMEWPTIPVQSSETANLVLSLLGSVLMAGCMALLAVGLRGATATRWIALAAFCYVTFGLNNQIEAAIFTTFGGTSAMLVLFVLPCLAGAAAAVMLLPGESDSRRTTVLHNRGISFWWWRVPVAWLAFPVIYIFFGMLAAPFVVPIYQQQDFGLTLPGWDTIIPVALLRSALYLAVTIPILLMWSRSRRGLTLTLGTAFFAMMGLIGLLTATFFPPVLRIVHSIEILGDALVYAWLLVALFVPKDRADESEPVPAFAD
jgi:hypothetical protein